MKTSNNDPREIVAKFGNCKKCGKSVKGEKVYYWPATRSVFCHGCGESDFNKSMSAIAYEDYGIVY